MRTSTALTRLRQLQPNGIGLKSDDSRRSLTATGDSDAIELARLHIWMFDLVAKPVFVQVVIESKVGKTMYRKSTKVLTGQPWTVTDPKTGVSISALTRLNDDLTFTTLFEFASKTFTRDEAVFRSRIGDPMTYTIAKDHAYHIEKDLYRYANAGIVSGLPKPIPPFWATSTPDPSDPVVRVVATNPWHVQGDSPRSRNATTGRHPLAGRSVLKGR